MTFFKTRRVLSSCAFFGIFIILGFIYYLGLNLDYKKYDCELYDKRFNKRCMNNVILDFKLSNGMNCSFCHYSGHNIDYTNRTCFYNDHTCFFGLSIILSDWVFFAFYCIITIWSGIMLLMCFGVDRKNNNYEKI